MQYIQLLGLTSIPRLSILCHSWPSFCLYKVIDIGVGMHALMQS